MILERQHGKMIMVDIKKFHNHSLGSFAGVSGEDVSSASLSVGPMCVCASVRSVFSHFMGAPCIPASRLIWLRAVRERIDDLRWHSDTLCRLSWSLMAEFPS